MHRWLFVVALAACHHGKTASDRIATCPDVAVHVQQLLDPKLNDPKLASEHAKHIHDIFATRCTRDKWPQPALTCMAGTAALHDGHHCKDQLSVDQRRTLDADLDALERDASASHLSTECSKYKKLMEQLVQCNTVAQATRDAMKQSFDSMMTNLKSASEEERKQFESTCKYGAEAVRQVGSGCTFR